MRRHQPPIVITALGSPKPVMQVVHDYGGLVFADVVNINLARKAAAAGVDGLACISAGAGGHTGHLSAFAFISAVREFFDGWIVVGGGIADGAGIAGAIAAGADFVYMGTRFLPSLESRAVQQYKQMVVDCGPDDVIVSAAITGTAASWLAPSLQACGMDPRALDAAVDPQLRHARRRRLQTLARSVGLRSRAAGDSRDRTGRGHRAAARRGIRTCERPLSRARGRCDMTTRVYLLGGYQTDFADNWARNGMEIADVMRHTVMTGLTETKLEPQDIEVAHIGNFAAELFCNQGHLGGLFAACDPAFAGLPASRHEGACASGSLAILGSVGRHRSGSLWARGGARSRADAQRAGREGCAVHRWTGDVEPATSIRKRASRGRACSATSRTNTTVASA